MVVEENPYHDAHTTGFTEHATHIDSDALSQVNERASARKIDLFLLLTI